MRILIVPGSNSLSHILKALSIKKYLTGHSTNIKIAISKQFLEFANSTDEEYFILPNIQETDSSNFPTLNWLKNKDIILECIKKERELIKNFKPDLILGIFNFTIKISALLEKTPFYALSCGCMLSESNITLGFDINDPERIIQNDYLNSFFHYLTEKMNKILSILQLSETKDIRTCIEGEKTFLWDFPEFMPLQNIEHIKHIGPIPYPCISPTPDNFELDPKKYAVISFGTCSYGISLINRLNSILTALGYSVIIPESFKGKNICSHNDNDIIHISGLPLIKILQNASLIITHGGQMTLFESLSMKIPLVVLPFQPEQDHNGLCIEKIKCGRRFFKSEPFNSLPNYYMNRFNSLSDDKIKEIILHVENSIEIKNNLEKYSNILKQYNSLETLKKEFQI